MGEEGTWGAGGAQGTEQRSSAGAGMAGMPLRPVLRGNRAREPGAGGVSDSDAEQSGPDVGSVCPPF